MLTGRGKQNFHLQLILLTAMVLLFATATGQTAAPSISEAFKINAVTGVSHLLDKPVLAYPEEARKQHIEGKVELELTVSAQGDVVSERVIYGPPALQQATIDAYKKAKYIPFLRNLEPCAALVQAIVAYENDHATISTESERVPEKPNPGDEFSMLPGSMRTRCGEFGLGTGAPGRRRNNLEILSDTQGVDFGPYFAQVVLPRVRQNWYHAIPESMEKRHGNVVIEFAITKDGKIGCMKLVTTSGEVPLDRAAWAGLVASDPFPPLPSEFPGNILLSASTSTTTPPKKKSHHQTRLHLPPLSSEAVKVAARPVTP